MCDLLIKEVDIMTDKIINQINDLIDEKDYLYFCADFIRMHP